MFDNEENVSENASIEAKTFMTAPINSPARTALRRSDAGLLLIDCSSDFASPLVKPQHLAGLPKCLRPGDVVVLNDAATLPASFLGRHCRTGESVEARLLEPFGTEQAAANTFPSTWGVVLFGAGDWRLPTERRPAPPLHRCGDAIEFEKGLQAIVMEIAKVSPRLVKVRFDAGDQSLLASFYASGRPIQYSYHMKDLEIWDVVTPFAARPLALEAPSASLHFTWDLVFKLRCAGIIVTTITHATGIASLGDPCLDALLPRPERYEISSSAANVINAAISARRRVIAVGTGSMRALEAAFVERGRGRHVRAGSAVACGRLSGAQPANVVSGLVTGMHELGTSHLALLESLAPAGILASAYELARADGFLWHEFGDLTLILR